MGRRRRAWLVGGNGRRTDAAGFYVRWNEYDHRGRRISHSRHFDSHRLAMAFVRRFNAQRELGMAGQLVTIGLREAIEDFLAELPRLAPATEGIYAADLAELLRAAGDVTASTVTGRIIDRMIVTAEDNGASPATIARKLRSVTRFYLWAQTQNYADQNPVKAASHRPRRVHARQRPAVTDRQLTQIVRSVTPDRRIGIWLALHCGLDRGTIQRLTPRQIDLEHACIRFVRQKTGAPNSVNIHADLIPLLRRRVAGMPPDRPFLSGLHRQDSRSDWWKSAARKAKAAGLLFRDLRALATRRAQDAGLALTDAQRLLGHASITTTATHYPVPDPAVSEKLSAVPLPGLPARRAAKAGKSARGRRRAS